MTSALVASPVTKREVAVGGFNVHATAYLITNGLAILAWLVTTILGEGPDFFFPVIPLAVWTPLVALHAYKTFRSVPDDAEEPLRLPFTITRREPE